MRLFQVLFSFVLFAAALIVALLVSTDKLNVFDFIRNGNTGIMSIAWGIVIVCLINLILSEICRKNKK